MSKLEYLKTLPKKRVAVGVLLFNDKHEILILKPSYKEDWTIPGGVVNEYESPIEAALRETKEEIDLDIKLEQCLIIDYVKYPIENEQSESLQIIFLGKQMSAEQFATMKIDNNEIIEAKFVVLSEAYRLLGTKLSKRVESLHENFNAFTFMENGVPVC
jgi:8-oxo-dGTP diphosphatase